MDKRSISWHTLNYFNSVLLIFGLYLPIKADRNHEKRKISGLVLFLVIIATLFSARKRYILIEYSSNSLEILTIIAIGCSCCYIVAIRYFKYNECNTFFSTLLAIATPSPMPQLTSSEEIKILVKTNVIPLLQCLIYSLLLSGDILCTIFCNRQLTYYIISDIFLDMTQFLEYLSVSITYTIMLETIQGLENSLEDHYSNYYKVPPAEIKKTEDGNLILVGWISACLSYNKNENYVEQIKDVLYNTFQIKILLEIFNNVFCGSVAGIIIIFLFKFVEILSKLFTSTEENYKLFINTLKLIFWMVCILELIRKNDKITNKLSNFGKKAYKCYVNMPSTVFLQDEVDIKDNLLIIQKLINGEDWNIYLFDVIKTNHKFCYQLALFIFFAFEITFLVTKQKERLVD